MSLTTEERQELIDAVVAKVLPAVYNKVEQMYLAMPEVIGSLMTQNIALLDINKEFYKANPDFSAYKPIVQAVIEQIEGSRPGIDYKDILKAAVPFIRERISVQAGLDMTTVKRPDRHMPQLGIERDTAKPFGEL